jgi:hypothetical protein
LLTPATILGTPAEAGLNQKNSTSLTLGTQTAFDFYPPQNFGGQAPCLSKRLCPKMLNGARKNLSNLVLNIITYLWDTTLVSIPLQEKIFCFKIWSPADEIKEPFSKTDITESIKDLRLSGQNQPGRAGKTIGRISPKS